ncbi:MAG: flagellar brake protein [Planctomycetes bacterium]|nr:flagellar brake protein [Planctomycetota bacterium]
MSATRSRNTDWKKSLQQVLDRQRMLELAVEREPGADEGVDIIWRSQMLALHDNMIEVESPSAIGRTIKLREGVKLNAAFVVGQNRFAFRTSILPKPPHFPHSLSLFLAQPESIERCHRKHDRFDLQGLQLPKATLWTLTDPRSVSLAERANELAFEAVSRGENAVPDADHSMMPELGAPIEGTLMNVSGGGVGIQFAPSEAAAISRNRSFWIRIAMGKANPVPIVCRGKLLHTHIDSMQNTYAGIVFDFSFNPAHQKTVAAQIALYVERVQAKKIIPR